MVDEYFGNISEGSSGVRVKLSTQGVFPSNPSEFGWVGIVAPFKKGDTDKLLILGSYDGLIQNIVGDDKGQDQRIRAARTYIRDYIKASGGAGGILAIRVTDGNEVQSSRDVYARRATRTKIGTLKAKNGGAWGGDAKRYTNEFSIAGDLTNTTLTTGVTTWPKDYWKGATLEHHDLTGKTYKVISSTAAGVLTVESDSKMKDEYDAASATSKRYYLTIDNANAGLSYKFTADASDTTSFNLTIYEDGVEIATWENLSLETDSDNYWKEVINEDGANYWIEVVDTYDGDRSSATLRPASYYGAFTGLTETSITVTNYDYVISSVGGGNPTLSLTTDAESVDETITLTFTSATAFDAVSDKFGALGSGTLGSEFTPSNKWSPVFTATAGATAMDTDDTITIQVKPLRTNEFKDGFLYPNIQNDGRLRYRISANTHNTITVQPSDTMDTDIDESPTEFLVEAPVRLEGGVDGISELSDSDYTKHFDVNESYFNDVRNDNFGLLKFVSPLNTATAVVQAMDAYAVAKGHLDDSDTPADKTTQNEIADWHLSTIGPSRNRTALSDTIVSVPDPYANRKTMTVSLLGKKHGLEARKATEVRGYTEAVANVDYIMTGIKKLPTKGNRIDKGYLESVGINTVLERNGGHMIWGNRIVTSDTAYRSRTVRMQSLHDAHYLRVNYQPFIFKPADITTINSIEADLKNYLITQQRRGIIQSYSYEINKDSISHGILDISVSIVYTETLEKINFNLNRTTVAVDPE